MEAVYNTVNAQCAVCKQYYDKPIRVAKIIPCSEGHIMCLQCLQNLFNTPAPSEKCFLMGKFCKASRHASCPMCENVFHLPEDDINKVLSYPTTEEEVNNFREIKSEMLKKMFQKKSNVLALVPEIVSSLRELQREANEQHYRFNAARVGGSVPAVVGGIMSIVGFGLSFVTFGASLGLMVAGGVLAGAGGITAGGAAIAEIVINRDLKNKIEEQVSQYQQEYEDLLKLLHEYSLMDSISNIGLKFWMQSSLGAAHIGHGVGTVVGVIRLGFVAADMAQEAAGTAVRIMSTAGRVFNIIGVVGAGVMLPFDIISVVWNSYDIHNRTPARLSSVIDEAISNIESSCKNLTDKIEEEKIDNVLKEHV